MLSGFNLRENESKWSNLPPSKHAGVLAKKPSGSYTLGSVIGPLGIMMRPLCALTTSIEDLSRPFAFLAPVLGFDVVGFELSRNRPLYCDGLVGWTLAA